MAFVFLATQGVSSRHNEVVGDRHRSRITNRKTKPRLASPPATRQRGHDDADDANTAGQRFVNDSGDEPFDVCGDRYLATDDGDAGLNQAKGDATNNNDLPYDLNQLSKSCYSFLGAPVEAFPSSLIKWPLDTSIKTKHLADIRDQVKQLSSAIKMTIDGEDECAALAPAHSNPSPFSSNVDISLLPSSSSSFAASPLPTFEDIDELMKIGKNKEAKEIVRQSNWSFDDGARKDLWKRLIELISNEKSSDFYYWDTVQQIYGSRDVPESRVVLPSFVDRSRTATHGLSESGIKACERIVSVIAYNSPAITFAPLIYPLTALLLHYMEEADAYNCMTFLLSKSNTYVSQTKGLHDTMWRTVKTLAKKHVKSSYSALQKFGLSQDQIDAGFQNWMWWMFDFLPLTHLVRVVDCFLLEGSKVLMRCALALFHLFVKQASRDHQLAAIVATSAMIEPIAAFCKSPPVSACKLLKTAFKIRALSKSEITKIINQTEMQGAEDGAHGAVGGTGSGNLPRSTSIEGLPTSESQENIQALSHTMGIKELLTIWGWIPTRMTMRHPTLVYTTQEHGSSLTSFYQRVDKYEPTILLVRTTNDEVFGAYCSTAWCQRNERDEYGHKQTYFGTGETFLFTLKPEPVRYEWVGITQQRQNVALGGVSHQSELFQHADHEMVTVGGGHGHGLMLDQALTCGKTETCETFNNPPLCSTPNFEIKVVEVFSLGEQF